MSSLLLGELAIVGENQVGALLGRLLGRGSHIRNGMSDSFCFLVVHPFTCQGNQGSFT